jgi:hypothetical protein
MRPESEYVGPASADYVPLEQRDATTRVEQKV